MTRTPATSPSAPPTTRSGVVSCRPAPSFCGSCSSPSPRPCSSSPATSGAWADLCAEDPICPRSACRVPSVRATIPTTKTAAAAKAVASTTVVQDTCESGIHRRTALLAVKGEWDWRCAPVGGLVNWLGVGWAGNELRWEEYKGYPFYVITVMAILCKD